MKTYGTIDGELDLLVDRSSLLFSFCYGDVKEFVISWLLCCCEDLGPSVSIDTVE